MRAVISFLGVVSAAAGWMPVQAQDEIRFVDGLRAEHVTVFLFETGLYRGSVQSVGDRESSAMMPGHIVISCSATWRRTSATFC